MTDNAKFQQLLDGSVQPNNPISASLVIDARQLSAESQELLLQVDQIRARTRQMEEELIRRQGEMRRLALLIHRFEQEKAPLPTAPPVEDDQDIPTELQPEEEISQ